MEHATRHADSALSPPREAINAWRKSMELKRDATPWCVLNPRDLKMLQRVLDRTLPAGSTPQEREFRAAILIHLFNDGKRSEAELVSAMLGAAEEAPSMAA
jgi:hypothetical protein